VSDHFWLDPDYEEQVEAQSVRLKLSTLYDGYLMAIDVALIQALTRAVFLALLVSAIYILVIPGFSASIFGINIETTIVSCKLTPAVGKVSGNINFTVAYHVQDGVTQQAHGITYFDAASSHTCDEFPIGTTLQVRYNLDDFSVYLADGPFDRSLWRNLGAQTALVLTIAYFVWVFVNGIAVMIQIFICKQQIKFIWAKGKR